MEAISIDSTDDNVFILSTPHQSTIKVSITEWSPTFFSSLHNDQKTIWKCTLRHVIHINLKPEKLKIKKLSYFNLKTALSYWYTCPILMSKFVTAWTQFMIMTLNYLNSNLTKLGATSQFSLLYIYAIAGWISRVASK